MSPEALTSRELARRIIDGEPAQQDATDSAAAAHAACERVYRDLARWVGAAGSAAVFTRALVTAQKDHPALSIIRIRPNVESGLAEVRDAVRSGESGVTSAAFEALLVELIELLSRFIGADLVVRLLDSEPISGRRGSDDG